MKKLSIVLIIVYCSLLVMLAGYKIINPTDTYFNYKKVVADGIKDYEKYSAANKKDDATNNNTQKVDTTAQPTTTTETITPVTEQTYETVSLTGTIGLGSKGDMVKRIQYLLKKKGYYNGEITGNYAQDTLTAVKKFQQDNKLGVDGYCGPATCNLLIK